jgi:flagellar basal-body rod protein FlgB
MEPVTDLFQLLQRRLEWVGARQGVLAQNVANVDTPGYTPRDVSPFVDLLHGNSIAMAQTEPGHLAPPDGGAGVVASRPEERAPDGNAVSLETELVKIADTGQAQQLALNLYGKYLSMFRDAIGKG